MNNRKYPLLAFAAGAALAVFSPVCRSQTLPDAPLEPAALQEPSTQVPLSASSPSTPAATARRPWSTIVEPGENFPLTVHDKLLYPAHEELHWTTPVAILYSGWYGILHDSDPKFGINAEGWGERVGAAALRQGISRELSDSLLPILLHQDPRYYRKAYGSYSSRGEYAASRVLFTERGFGLRDFNYSGVFGRGMNAALTETYYPSISVGTGVVLRTWGFSLLESSGTDAFNEFWPDIRRKLFHKSH